MFRSIRISLSTVLTILVFHAALSQHSQIYTGSNLTTQEASNFLSHHNMARQELNIAPIQWDTALATYAQEWANYLANKKKCKMIHRYELKQNEAGYGENIFWGSSAKFFTPVDASIAWYNEKEKYNGEAISWEGLPKSGHYTQMIWRSTIEVGAGKAVCPSGAIIIVANYNPGGNIIGGRAY